MKTNNKTFIILYILLAYVILQFLWWTYSLVDLHQSLILHKNLTAEEMQVAFVRKKWMIFGEGAIFLFLIILGGFYVRKSFLKQLKLNNRQTNFLLAITHELKTPIASIKLNLQSLKRSELQPEMKEKLIENSLNDNERLSKLLNKALLSARIEKEGFSSNKSKQNLSELVESITSLWNQKGGMNVNIEEDILFEYDKTGMESVINNLIENAFKYSDNREIKIGLKQTNSEIELSVSDLGKGISDSEKENIFDKFYRIENEATRETKGTGLGLYIVKSIVDDHNGTVSVKDNSPKGTTFAVKFPNND